MKEINAIIEAYQNIDFTQTRAALATVSRVEGSSYRRAGARMLVFDDGNYIGGISGGCLEGDALRRAQKAIALNTPSVVTYDTTQEDSHQIGVGLGCNGIIDVLFTPLLPDAPNNPVRLLEQIATTRLPRILVTVTDGGKYKEYSGSMFLYDTDDTFITQFPDKETAQLLLPYIKQSAESLSSQTCTFPGEDTIMQVFIEVIRPVTHLVIYGGNYDIYPLVRIASELGWNTTVVMNTAKADKSLFNYATQVLHNKGCATPEIDNYTAVVLMAHDYNTDFQNFRQILQTPAAYIGLLGPKKRTQKMLDALAAEQIELSAFDQQRVYSPAGLDIGAATPEEIALSIVAEIRTHFTGRQGMPLRQRQGTIYGD